MPFKAIMFILGISEQSGTNVFQLVFALWLFSVSYLLYRRADQALRQQGGNAPLSVPQGKLPYLTAESYRATSVN